jgi:hypothetical protein
LRAVDKWRALATRTVNKFMVLRSRTRGLRKPLGGLPKENKRD